MTSFRRAVLAVFLPFMLVGSPLAGAAEPGGRDGRTVLLVEAGERDFVLREMRRFLESVQEITEGLASGDMKQVAQAARVSGMAAARGMPASLAGKLPQAAKKLGGDTHRRFDRLADSASQVPDRQELLGQLAALLQNCTACHAAYRLQVAP